MIQVGPIFLEWERPSVTIPQKCSDLTTDHRLLFAVDLFLLDKPLTWRTPIEEVDHLPILI